MSLNWTLSNVTKNGTVYTPSSNGTMTYTWTGSQNLVLDSALCFFGHLYSEGNELSISLSIGYTVIAEEETEDEQGNTVRNTVESARTKTKTYQSLTKDEGTVLASMVLDVLEGETLSRVTTYTVTLSLATAIDLRDDTIEIGVRTQVPSALQFQTVDTFAQSLTAISGQVVANAQGRLQLQETLDELDVKVLNAQEVIAQKVDTSYLTANYITAGDINATYATITNLNAQKARIDTIESDNVTINNKLTAAEADITTLTADTATINGKITAAEGRIGDLEADHVSTTDFQATTARIGTLEADNATINGKLTAAEGDITTLQTDLTTANTLIAGKANIDLANVNNAWIQNGVIKDAAISDAQIIGVSANKLTAGTIDASNITVTNLNASNITAGTLNGQRIGTGSLSLDKLSEDVYTEAEVDAKLATMQDEIDGAIETWTGTVVPTLNNTPASGWTTNADKDKHVGDVYYVVNAGNQADGYCYRFAKSGNTYSWVLIKDSDVTAALQRLIDAEGDIDGLQSFESETSAWITDTDEELSSLKTNHTTLATVVDKTLVSTTQLWYTKANTTAPNKPTAHVTSTSTAGNAWRTVVPAYNSSYPNYFYCYEWQYADGTYGWSDVTRDIGMGETQSTARTASSNASTALTNAATAQSAAEGAQSTANTAVTNAATAQTTANTANTNAQAAQNTANANIKSTVQLWFTKANTTAPSKPTAHVTTNNASTANAWNIAVPTYNATYPNYFYCYEYQKGDNTYSWSDVVLDRATTENQANARSALSQVATKVETSVFNTVSQQVDTNTANITSLTNTVSTKADSSTVTTLSNTVNSVQQTANSNTSKISNLTTRLGTNADGTEGTNDIVAKEAALEQDLSGFKTTVSSTYATQANLNTEINQRKAMYGTSSTAAGTTAKAVTCANFALYTGARVAVTFSNANTATVPTLNVNSTGAKTIKSFSGAALTEAEYKWAAGSTLEFIYDGTNWRLADEGTLKRLNAAEGTLSTHSTTIEQNTNAIALKANATDVYTKTQTDGLISTEVTNRNAAITTSADAINLSVSQNYTTKTEFNNLEIGGRNYFKNSSFNNGTKNWLGVNNSSISITTFDGRIVLTATKGSSDNLYCQVLQLYYTAGEYVEVVVSAKMYSEEEATWHASAYVASNGWKYVVDKTTYQSGNSLSIGWNDVVATIRIYSSTYSNNLIIVFGTSGTTAYLYHPKLEIGNKATDWTPAPEDLEAYADSAVSTAKSEIKQTTDNISLEVSKKVGASEVISKINQSPESITINANRVNIEGTITAINNNTTTTIDGGKITTGTLTVGALSSGAQAQVLNSEIEVGGRNLLRNTNKYSEWFKSGDASCYTVTDEYIKFTPPTTARWWILEPLPINIPIDEWDTTAQYTLSIDCKFEGSITVSGYPRIAIATKSATSGGYATRVREKGLMDLDTIAAQDDWGRYTVSFSGDYNTGWYNYGGTPVCVTVFIWLYNNSSQYTAVYFKNLKLEKGNKATDWTPAPEDVDAGIDDAAKTATSYIVANSTGLMVANMVGSEGQVTPSGITSGYNTLITPTSFNVRDGQTVLASFGETTTIGDTSSNAYLELTSNSFMLNTVNSNYPLYEFGNFYSEELILEFIPSTQYYFYYESDLNFDLLEAYIYHIDDYDHDPEDWIEEISDQSQCTLSKVYDSTAGQYVYGVTITSTVRANMNPGDSIAVKASSNVEYPYFRSGIVSSDLVLSPGRYSSSFGENCVASGYASFAEGINNTASGMYAHAEGTDCKSSGEASHSEGGSCEATEAFAHSEGEVCRAEGEGSHSEGYHTESLGMASHSEGNSTSASGEASHAQNLGTTASYDYCTAIGRYNSDGNYALMIGNGTDNGDGDFTYSNALTVDWSGNVVASGKVKIADGYEFTSTSTRYGPGSIEMYNTTPFIDFHYGNTTSDYDTRLVVDASCRLSMIALPSINADAMFRVYKASSHACQVRVQNSVNSGDLQITSAGAFGLYARARSNWLIYVGTSGNSSMPLSSDRRIKNHIQDTPTDEAVDLLRNIKVRQFTYKGDEHEVVTNGFYAQDIRDHLISKGIGYRPYLNIQSNEEDNESIYYDMEMDEDKVQYGLEYHKLVPELWLGWQYHDNEIDKLKKRITTLELLLVKNNITFD